MRVRNLAVATLVVIGAGALAVRGLMKDQELAEKAKKDGKKVLNDAKELGATVKTAATSVVDEIKEKLKTAEEETGELDDDEEELEIELDDEEDKDEDN